MNMAAFDTMAYARRLQDAGFSEPQAEALARAQADALEKMLATSQIATRADTLLLQKDLAALGKEMAEMETRLIKWMVTPSVGPGAFLVAVMAWLKQVNR